MSFSVRSALLSASLVLAVPLSAVAQDSDGDGVTNAADAFPCDATAAAVAFAPSESTMGLLVYEDQWPSASDLDFNDVVFRYRVRAQLNGSGQATRIFLYVAPIALGGALDNGLGWQLPVASTAVSQVNRRINGGAWSALGRESDGQLTVRLSDNLRELFAGQSGVINAIPGEATLTGQAMEIEIVLSTPTALSMGAAPFDLFIFRSGDFPHQTHFPWYAGTAAMRTSLFGSQNDRSTATRHFVYTDGTPFALNLQNTSNYPREGREISSLFPNIVGFASSAGTTNQNFYSSTVVAAHGLVAPSSSNPASPAADTSCIEAELVWQLNQAWFSVSPNQACGGCANNSPVPGSCTVGQQVYTSVGIRNCRYFANNTNPGSWYTAGEIWAPECNTAVGPVYCHAQLMCPCGGDRGDAGRDCSVACSARYAYTAWSACSAACGAGTQQRLCMRNDGVASADARCGGQGLSQSCSGQLCSSAPAPSTFAYTGANQTYTVPAGVSRVRIKAWGAGGYSAYGVGGPGGYAEGSLTVTPGQVLTVVVGQSRSGGSTAPSGFRAFGGGGGGWAPGGGYSGVFAGAVSAANARVIAGGGGGAGRGYGPYANRLPHGGAGGTIGTAGSYSHASYTNSFGRGATASAGGAGGIRSGGSPWTVVQDGFAGASLTGGDAGNLVYGDPSGSGGYYDSASGGGGGGYFGGGGGAPTPTGDSHGGGGGGGACFVSGSATSPVTMTGWSLADPLNSVPATAANALDPQRGTAGDPGQSGRVVILPY